MEIVRNIYNIPELRKRIIFTFLMLVVYRVGAHIPTPGIDLQALDSFRDGGSMRVPECGGGLLPESEADFDVCGRLSGHTPAAVGWV